MLSFNVQSTTLSTNLVNDIKNNLVVNASSVIPPGLVLTNDSFMILAFQPNCKYLAITYVHSSSSLYLHA